MRPAGGGSGKGLTDVLLAMGPWALANFAIDLAALWTVGALRGSVTVPRRLVLGALAGTAVFFVFPPWLPPAVLLPAAVASSAVMAAIAFRPRTLAALTAAVVTLWAVGFAAAGAGLAVAENLPPQPERAGVGATAAVLAMLAATRIARRFVASVPWARALRLCVEVTVGDHRIPLSALVDTGNRLTEPVSGLPVILVDARTFSHHLDAPLAGLVAEMARSPWQWAGRLTGLDAAWAARFRLVPFRSIGTECGLLAGFRVDSLTLEGPAVPRFEAGQAVVAISPTPLRSGEVEALVPAECLAAARVRAGTARDAGRPREVARSLA